MPRKQTEKGSWPTKASRRELDRETSEILRLKKQIAKNFWDLGAALVRVNDRQLFLASGYRSFVQYLKKEVKISHSTAYRLMDLARNFSRETAIEFGQTKLLCAIDYAKATPEPDRPLDVTRYEFEGKNRSGKKVTKSFKQATSREIRRATALLKKKPRPVGFPRPDNLPSDLAGLLSGKTPSFQTAPFVQKAREKLKDLSPRPALSLKVTKKGDDPLVELRLSNARASTLLTAFGLLAAAAYEAWLGSLR